MNQKEEYSDYFRIESKDGFQFFLKESFAVFSEVLKNMIDSGFYFYFYNSKFLEEYKKKDEKVIKLNYDSNLVEKIVQYFHYKKLYNLRPKDRVPFVIDDDNIVLKLAVASYELKT